MRLKHICPEIHLTSCYLRDHTGATCVGEDAEVLKMYMIEQEILSAWIKSNKDEEEAIKLPEIIYPAAKPKVYTTIDAALKAFVTLTKKKEDKCH